MRKAISENKLKFYTVDADSIAARCGMGPRVNVPMETIFLSLSNIIPFDVSVAALKEQIKAAYMHEGGDVVERTSKTESCFM